MILYHCLHKETSCISIKQYVRKISITLNRKKRQNYPILLKIKNKVNLG